MAGRGGLTGCGNEEMTCGNEEMTFYRARRIVSVWENEPKFKEMTGTHP